MPVSISPTHFWFYRMFLFIVDFFSIIVLILFHKKRMIMKKHLLCLSILMLSLFSYAQSGTIDTGDPRLTNLAEELDSILPNFNSAGFAVAVVEKDQVIYAKGFGYRDYEQKIPADANTLFAIGSCTKAFTASLLGQLRKAEKVDFTESPITYLPEMRFFNDEMNNHIQIRDIMTHRTGLPRHDLSWYVFHSDSEEELIKRIQYHEPTFGLRERWQYNNFMFLLQGGIAKAISGKPWHELAQETITTPLEMSRTNFNIDAMEAAANVSLGYGINADDEIEKLDYYRIRAMSAAGSINSSVNDMAKWVITWINGGEYKDQEILPSTYVKEAISSQMVIAPALPTAKHPDIQFANYGYGWFLQSYRGHYLVQHGGNIDGFSANTSFYPSDSIGIVVLSNQNGSPIPTVVRNIVSDRMLNLEKEDWHAEIKAQLDKASAKPEEDKEEAEEGVPSAHALEDFEGSFHHPGYGTIKVSQRNDSLFGHTPHLELWLSHKNFDHFTPIPIESLADEDPEGLPFIMGFQTDVNGRISGMTMPLEGGLDPILFKRKVEEKAMDAAALEIYVGKYALAPTVLASVYIKDGKTLYVEVPGQPEYELVPIGNDAFSLKILDGYSVEFDKNAEGVIEGLQFVQPNGTFKAKKQ